jgi:hypothetical protein
MNTVLLLALFASDPIGCPKTIQVKEQLASPVAGWAAASDGMAHQLAGLTFFDGKPEEKASLAPDSHLGNRSTWKFDIARPTWVECHYAGTGVTLTRELPHGTSTCVVSYRANETIAGLPVIQNVDCKTTATK